MFNQSKHVHNFLRKSQHNLARVVAAGLLATTLVGSTRAADVYLMNDNHTDYGWNATVDTAEDTMVSELDYYLDQVDATASLAPDLQAKYAADSWWYLYTYQRKRTPQQFARLISAAKAGRITFPLNPLVDLYGAMTTEGAIRAGYWPGRMQRLYGIDFKRAQAMENATIPYGLSGIWAGSGAQYVWHGICGCVTDTPYAAHTTPLFRWRAPDNRELLVKWYPFSGNSASLGGYAEARSNLSLKALGKIALRTDLAPSSVPLIGVFGIGWDDVISQTQTPYDLAKQWVAQVPPSPNRLIVSNGIDYFDALQPYTSQLPVLSGGWGLDWELCAAALAQPTAAARNSVERLRTVEMLAALAAPYAPGLWASLQPKLEGGLIDHMRYFEHTWGTVNGIPLQSVIDHKREWASTLATANDEAETATKAVLAPLFATPNQQRFAVLNPLGFTRTDIADLPLAPTAASSQVVTDVATGNEVPAQVITSGGKQYLRILARDVPSLGYRVYSRRAGTSTIYTRPAATGTTGLTSATLESDDYRVRVDGSGSIASLIDKTRGRQLAGQGLNVLAGGQVTQAKLSNVGPVSATLNLTLTGTPARQVALTLFRDVNRLEIDDRIVNFDVPTSGAYHYRFAFNLPNADIRFEELGAIAKPGLTSDGGNFLPGSRTQYMALNHFVSLIDGSYAATLSNEDSFAMRIGDSGVSTFDLPSSVINVFAVGNPYTPGINPTTIKKQAGDQNFRHRFAIFAQPGAYSAAEAMRGSLAHQNPLYVLPLTPNSTGPWTAPTASFLSISSPNVVVSAFKPAEEEGRGLVVRLWELNGAATNVPIDVSSLNPTDAYRTTLIENDLVGTAIDSGAIRGWVGANMMRTYRFQPHMGN